MHDHRHNTNTLILIHTSTRTTSLRTLMNTTMSTNTNMSTSIRGNTARTIIRTSRKNWNHTSTRTSRKPSETLDTIRAVDADRARNGTRRRSRPHRRLHQQPAATAGGARRVRARQRKGADRVAGDGRRYAAGEGGRGPRHLRLPDERGDVRAVRACRAEGRRRGGRDHGAAAGHRRAPLGGEAGRQSQRLRLRVLVQRRSR